MRTTFSSTDFASQAADRLAALLPALSLDQARDWTAQVYGYRNWHQLAFDVENAPQPPGPDLSPDLKYAMDCYYAGKYSYEDMQRHKWQLRKLGNLLGWTQPAAEHLYVIWEPRRGGPAARTRLADIGPGTPAFQAMQWNVFVPVDETGPLVTFDGSAGTIHDGFPGSAAQLQSASAAFLEQLPRDIPERERLELHVDLTRTQRTVPELRPIGGPNTFAQVLPMTFFACREDADLEIVGAASVTFALTASCDGSHFVRISLERMALLSGASALPFEMAEAMSVSVWEALSRYLWCTVGNTDNEALVRIEYREGNALEQVCATRMRALIADYCGLPLGCPHPAPAAGIKFELVPAGSKTA